MTKPQCFREIVFPDSRITTIDVCELGRKKHHIAALLEIDVTNARALFRDINTPHNKGQSLSFTAWFVQCVAVALSGHMEAAAYLKSRKSMLISDNIDISVVVEKELGGYMVPFPLVLRDCKGKSLKEISGEIRAAQETAAEESTVVIGEQYSKAWIKLFYLLPAPLRRWVLKTFLLTPKTAIKTMGSVIVTSVGVAGNIDGWMIPTSVHPLCFAVGSIIKKPGVVGSEIKIREYLKLTALFDHDVMDGAPAARFLSSLNNLLNEAHGLKDFPPCL